MKDNNPTYKHKTHMVVSVKGRKRAWCNVSGAVEVPWSEVTCKGCLKEIRRRADQPSLVTSPGGHDGGC